jgi:putative transposase
MHKLHFGLTYHIYNRGVNRCNLFHEKGNYLYFLKQFAQRIAPIADVYAYCLLPNHFHFLLRLKTADEILANPDLHEFWPHTRDNRPHQFFSNFFNGYARAFNEQHGRTGSLFQRPFGRIPVPTDAYFHTLVAYIHRNPRKHGLIADFRDWPYSSYEAILHDKATRVDKTAVLDWFGGREPFQQAHQNDPDEPPSPPTSVIRKTDAGYDIPISKDLSGVLYPDHPGVVRAGRQKVILLLDRANRPGRQEIGRAVWRANLGGGRGLSPRDWQLGGA